VVDSRDIPTSPRASDVFNSTFWEYFQCVPPTFCIAAPLTLLLAFLFSYPFVLKLRFVPDGVAHCKSQASVSNPLSGFVQDFSASRQVFLLWEVPLLSGGSSVSLPFRMVPPPRHVGIRFLRLFRMLVVGLYLFVHMPLHTPIISSPEFLVATPTPLFSRYCLCALSPTALPPSGPRTLPFSHPIPRRIATVMFL